MPNGGFDMAVEKVRGVRGATTVENDLPAEIYSATQELLTEMIALNSIDSKDVAAVLFSMTPDLKSAFPAKAARLMGWETVPLFCQVEIDVPESLPLCIRVLILLNTIAEQDAIKHVYLRDSTVLLQL
jgi:chorismate mutase